MEPARGRGSPLRPGEGSGLGGVPGVAGDARGWSHCGEGCSAPPGCWVLVPPASPRYPGNGPRSPGAAGSERGGRCRLKPGFVPAVEGGGWDAPRCCPACCFVPQFPHSPPKSDGEGMGPWLGGKKPLGEGKGGSLGV